MRERERERFGEYYIRKKIEHGQIDRGFKEWPA